MTNFTINFSCAWLLLLLIPIGFLALFPHFRVSKKYRRTRNRITSLVLHCVIMVLSVLVLAGMSFEYDIPNDENEILLLVDMSHSSRQSEEDKDDFVRSVINYSDSRYKVGVVTFGYDQVYAAPFSYDGNAVYNQYTTARLPDTSATDLEAALTYARSLLKYPETSKIVIVSDGVETDGKAMSVIRSIAADGVHVDTRYFHEDVDDDVQLIGVDLPDYTLVVGDVFNLSLTVQSSYVGAASVNLYDNGDLVATKTVNFLADIQSISMQHSFERTGMHSLTFSIEAQGDTLNENNNFNSYIYLETYDKLLVLESNSGESDQLVEILEQSDFNVDVVNVHDAASMPSTLSALCAYDQVIMMNIAHADLPQDGFEDILNSYVYDIGGGMFTIGGDKIGEDGKLTANAYNRDDMINTTYQRMLPVQAIDYTPPLGLIIIIDRSGSMGSGGSSGRSRLDAAKDGAFACLDVLSERDWCGVMSLESDFQQEIDLTPATQRTVIREAIDKITLGGATMFSPAIRAAGQSLKQLDTVERRHIILITDGLPGEAQEKYEDVIADNFAAGITFTVVGIEISSSAEIKMTHAAEEVGGGRFINVKDLDELRNVLRDELTLDVIQQYVPKEFTPTIRTHTAAVVGITGDMPILGGYYGTRLKSNATAVLVGDYVPVYAQWKYGEGMVGSFMSDLRGTEDSWSYTFMHSENGVRFITNVVKSLFPTKNIRPTDIRLELTEQNYRTQMSIFTTLNEGEQIDVTVFKVSDDGLSESVIQTIRAGANDDYSRVTFTNREAGVYRILVQKSKPTGSTVTEDDIISECDIYKVFSYSKEYDVFVDYEKCREFLSQLSELGSGGVVTNADEVFMGFVDKLHKVIDPRLAMIIIALILFLIDIAVRKFKFKWPHEIVRDYRNKKKS